MAESDEQRLAEIRARAPEAWCETKIHLQLTRARLDRVELLRWIDDLRAQFARAEKVIEGEREARHKCEAALRAKDRAMGVLLARLQSAGVDCADLVS